MWDSKNAQGDDHLARQPMMLQSSFSYILSAGQVGSNTEVWVTAQDYGKTESGPVRLTVISGSVPKAYRGYSPPEVMVGTDNGVTG